MVPAPQARRGSVPQWHPSIGALPPPRERRPQHSSAGRIPRPATRLPGGHRSRVTPVPIPNTEVKPATADGTASAGVWESRSLPGVNARARCARRIGPFFAYAARSTRRAGMPRERIHPAAHRPCSGATWAAGGPRLNDLLAERPPTGLRPARPAGARSRSGPRRPDRPPAAPGPGRRGPARRHPRPAAPVRRAPTARRARRPRGS
jgi:hypothetical protein